MTRKIHATSVGLSETDIQRLQEFADSEGTSRSDFFRRLLWNYSLQTAPVEPNGPDSFLRAAFASFLQLESRGIPVSPADFRLLLAQKFQMSKQQSSRVLRLLCGYGLIFQSGGGKLFSNPAIFNVKTCEALQ